MIKENIDIHFSSSDAWIMQTKIHCTCEDREASLKIIKLTQKGKEEFGEVINAKKSLSKEMENIQKVLKADCWKPNEEFPPYDNTQLQDFFTEIEFEETCRVYHEEAMQIIRKMT